MSKLFINVPGLIGVCNDKKTGYPNRLPVKTITDDDSLDIIIVEDPYGNHIMFPRNGLVPGDDVQWEQDWNALKYGSISSCDTARIIKKHGSHCARTYEKFNDFYDPFKISMIESISDMAKRVLPEEKYADDEYRSVFCNTVLSLIFDSNIPDLRGLKLEILGKLVHNMLSCRYVTISGIDWSK